MDTDFQTENRLLSTTVYPQIMSLRAKRGNLPISADSSFVIPAKACHPEEGHRGNHQSQIINHQFQGP